MHPILQNVFESKEFINNKGETIKIHSETSEKQCEFLQNIIRENKFKNSIEIGFAYGLSTLAIVEEVTKNGGRHVVIDKFENNAWGGNGLDLINQAGYSGQLEFYEEFCYQALPKFLDNGRTFDFAYIDSTKQLDWLLVDFFYLDKLMEVNGIIVFDDVRWPSVRKLLRYISQFPNYKVYSQFPRNIAQKKSWKVDLLLKVAPKLNKFLKEEFFKSDYELQINANCVALIKVNEDKRNWDWHVKF
jgi:predicted O-methyltransferase YrrM